MTARQILRKPPKRVSSALSCWRHAHGNFILHVKIFWIRKANVEENITSSIIFSQTWNLFVIQRKWERKRDHDSVICRAYFIVFLFSKHLDIMLATLVSIDFLGLDSIIKTVKLFLEDFWPLSPHSLTFTLKRPPKRLSQEKNTRNFPFFFCVPMSFPVFLKWFYGTLEAHGVYILRSLSRWSESECGPPGPLNLGRRLQGFTSAWMARKIIEFVARYGHTD